MKFANFTKWLYNKTHKVKISDYEAKIDSLRRLVDAGEVEMRVIQSKYKEETIRLKTKIPYYPAECDTEAILAMLAQGFGEHLIYNKYVDIKIEDFPYDNNKIVTMSLNVLKKEW
jgi:hypothetical protein